MSPHKLRHLYNNVARMEQVDPTVRSKLLNQLNPRSITTYDHVLPFELVSATEQVSRGRERYLAKATKNDTLECNPAGEPPVTS